MNNIRTYTKKVKDSSVHPKEIIDAVDIDKLTSIIARLDALPSAITINFNELGIRTNPKKWIQILLDCSPVSDGFTEMENLLNDFTEGMMTRMREDSKYVLGLLTDNNLVLCHSIYGEETITPEWKIIPRMLDIDNVLRYVSFSLIDSGIQVKYWEREATSSFIEWLGLSRKQAFLIGGKYRVCTEIENFTVELQLTDQEFEKWIETHPEFIHGKISLKNAVSMLCVREIRVGSKVYRDPGDFKQDYDAERFGVPRYIKEYERIKATNLPLLIRYFDDETKVVRIEGDEEVNEVTKNNLPFHILFANGTPGPIDIRISYLNELLRKVLNNETLQIFHAGMKFNVNPLTIGNIKIFNDMRTDALMTHLLTYYNEINLQDRVLELLIKYSTLKIVALTNSDSPLAFILNEISGGILQEIKITGRLSKVEDEIIEYKSRDIVTSKDRDVIEYFVKDINKKLTRNGCKLYIVGVEDNGMFNPIQTSRLGSDRVEIFRKGLQRELQFSRIYVFTASQLEKTILFVAVVNLSIK